MRGAIKQRVLLMPIKILWRFLTKLINWLDWQKRTEVEVKIWHEVVVRWKTYIKISCGWREWEEIKNPMSRCFCCWFFPFISPRFRTSELPQRRVIQANKKSYSFLLFSINKKSLSSLLWYLRRSICWRAHGERKRQWSKC